MLTRYLTLVKFAGYGNVRSSGRVQTPTLALIVARERERLAFVPEDYWVIKGAFDAGATVGPTAGDGELAFAAPHATARFKERGGGEGRHGRRVAARQAPRWRRWRSARAQQQPPVPFNTTSRSWPRHRRRAFRRRAPCASPKACTWTATFPTRVSTTRCIPSSLDLAEVVKTHLGQPGVRPVLPGNCCSAGKLHATRGKKETTDHPPIYPTAKATPDDLAPAEYKLYNLIARRFLATLSDAAVVEGTKVTLEVGGEQFAATRRRAGEAGLSCHLPVRHEEGRAAARS